MLGAGAALAIALGETLAFVIEEEEYFPATGVSSQSISLLSTTDTDVLRLGGEYQRYRLDDLWPPSPATLPPGLAFGGMAPDTFYNINDGERDRAALFAEWEAQLGPQWLTLIGGQVLRYTDFDLDLTAGGNVYASASLKFKRSRVRWIAGLEVDTLDISIFASTASTTTMASSTTMPMDSTMPNSVSVLME